MGGPSCDAKELEPERHLWWAVIGQAMRDLTHGDPLISDDARYFFAAKPQDEWDGFGAICELLGLDRSWASRLAVETALPAKKHLKPHARTVSLPYNRVIRPSIPSSR